MTAWNIQGNGPTVEATNRPGNEENPLDISSLGVELSLFKLANMIISDTEYDAVQNLTWKKVSELDQLTENLMLDIHRAVYIGRTRLGDETGS